MKALRSSSSCRCRSRAPACDHSTVTTTATAADLPIRRNTALLAATMAVNSAVLQLVAAVASLTFVLVTGFESLLGLGPAIFLTASAVTAVPAGRSMDRFGRVLVIA